MLGKGWKGMSLVTAGTLGLLAAASRGEESTPNSRIERLRERIATLEAQQAADHRDLAATIDQLLRDAERRSQLLATSGEVSAGYDKGFFIRGGGDWYFHPSFWSQFRYIANSRDDVRGHNGDSTETGFELRRVRFEIDGTALCKRLEYDFCWDSDRDSGEVSLLDAWGKYMFTPDWGVVGGQMKDPVSHEYLVSSKRQLAVDRSLADNLVGGSVGNRTQGVFAVYGNRTARNPLYVQAGITDGADQLNTDFEGRGEPLPVPEPIIAPLGKPKAHSLDWGLAGRAEYKVMGDWGAYRDFTAKGTKEDLLVFGAGGDWSQGGDGNLILGALDAQYENTTGLGLYGAALYHYVDQGKTGADDASSDWGLLVQAGYLFTPAWEVFARYDVTLVGNSIEFGNGRDKDAFHEITAGINYYLGRDGSAGHAAKITVDLVYLPNGAPQPQSGLGIVDNNSGHAEWVLRTQFQLAI